ncbi:MAG: toll/interleukin-1 receptor domain-containing protein [Clostridia bacterium]|nr:toll/interleukin-1 receptor domain-containing protein [Clostridia bacterium]
MYQYDFFFIYSPKGGSSAERLYGLLCQRGYRCVFRGSSAGYEAFFTDVRETIRRSRAIIVLVSDDLTRSKYASMEMAYALSDACGRGKRIFPVVTTEGLPDELVRYIGNYEEIRVNSGEGHAWEAVAERIDLSMRDQSVDSQLLEQLSEYRRLKQDNRWADVLCRIIERTQQKVTDTPPHSLDRSARLRELCSLHEQLAEYHGLYDQESRKMAKCIVRTLNRTKALLTGESFPEGVYFAALAVRFIYLDREIRTECADILSDGDVHGVNHAGYLEEQKPHLAVMDAYLADSGEQDEDLLTFVRDTEKYRLTGICTFPPVTPSDPRIGDSLPRSPRRRKFCALSPALFGRATSFLTCSPSREWRRIF